MTKKLIGLVAGIAVIGGSATLFAQEGTKPANVGEGTVMVKGKSYLLKNAVAYETHDRRRRRNCGGPERSNDFKREA